MIFNKGNLVGTVTIAFSMRNSQYSIQNTFRNFNLELPFFIYMIDKLIADCTDQTRAMNLLANVVGYVNKSNKIIDGYRKMMGHYIKVDYIAGEKDFELKVEFLHKEGELGTHFYIWSKFSPILTQNAEGKLGIAALFYTDDIYNRLPENERVFLKEIVNILFNEYQILGFPSANSITIAPANVVNKITRLSEFMNEYN